MYVLARVLKYKQDVESLCYVMPASSKMKTDGDGGSNQPNQMKAGWGRPTASSYRGMEECRFDRQARFSETDLFDSCLQSFASCFLIFLAPFAGILSSGGGHCAYN